MGFIVFGIPPVPQPLPALVLEGCPNELGRSLPGFSLSKTRARVKSDISIKIIKAEFFKISTRIHRKLIFGNV